MKTPRGPEYLIHDPLPYRVVTKTVGREDCVPVFYTHRVIAYSVIEAMMQAVMLCSSMPWPDEFQRPLLHDVIDIGADVEEFNRRALTAAREMRAIARSLRKKTA